MIIYVEQKTRPSGEVYFVATADHVESAEARTDEAAVGKLVMQLTERHGPVRIDAVLYQLHLPTIFKTPSWSRFVH